MVSFKRRLKKHLRVAGHHAKDHFIPHRGNNHHPHILRHRVLLGYSVILILLKVISIIGPIALPSSSLYSSAITAKNIIDLTNQTRKNLNLPEMKESSYLAKAAAAKAADMLKNQYFAHTSPSGTTPWVWIKQAGYRYRYGGENLAVHFEEAEDVEAGWLASASHRANIVNPNYTEIGVGVVNGIFEGVPTTFVVQMFGTPVSGGTAAVTATSGRATNRFVAAGAGTLSANAGEVASAEAVDGDKLKKVVSESVINESSLRVKAMNDAYAIRLEVKNATSVVASLGSESRELSRAGSSDIWNGGVPYDSHALGATGELLLITAANNETPPVTKPVMVIAPSAPTQRFYVFNEGTDKFTKFFGFIKVGNLDDKVRQFYVGFIVFLGAVLLLNFFVLKFRLRHPSVLKHAVAVMSLALFLIIV